jgi:peptide-methionine (R)-S-oxide reductase
MKKCAFLRTILLGAVGGTLTILLLNIFITTKYSGLATVVEAAEAIRVYSTTEGGYIMTEKVVKSPEEWRQILTPEQYYVLREKNTEPAFSGQYDKHYKKGIYRCAGCGLDLYASEDKFDSRTGWPSFTRPVAEENINTAKETYYLWERTELLCARCDGHLGHVFDDGPPPSGLRHCINSVSITFVPDK